MQFYLVNSKNLTTFTYPNKLKVIKMLQSEFKERTGVEVTSKEFDAIHIVYMESDLDKDEFCKTWCKMNASRVSKAKELAKSKEEERKLKDSLIEIRNKLSSEVINGGNLPLTIAYLSDKELTLLEKVGIEIQISKKEMVEYGYPFQRFHDISDTRYKIEKYLNIA